MIGQETLNDEYDAQQRRNEDMSAAFEERVNDYIPTILSNGAELTEVFRELAENEEVLLQWGDAIKEELGAKAELILLGAIQTELRLLAERSCEEND